MFTPNASIVWRLGDYDQPTLQWNGIDDFGVEWAVEPIVGWRTTSVSVPSDDLPGDGSRFGPGRFLSRVLTVRGLFRRVRVGADLDAAEDRLRDALEHVREDQVLAVTEPVPKQVTCRLTGDLTVDVHTQRVRKFSAVLTCDDPLKYAAGGSGLITVELALRNRADAGGVKFPVQMPMRFTGGKPDPSMKNFTDPGRVAIKPELQFDGPVTGGRILHSQSQAFYGISGLIDNGLRGVADLAGRSLTIDNQSRTSRRYPGSKHWAIVPGKRNDVQFVADNYSPGAKARLIYRPAWR